ncbi:hypothetical protein C1H46_035884 [Malus baccata]|uniref:Uncharacterized protein n=1 Tax=Malus baccata TaxID=106549 RepID=A0A540KWK4_MALBA|nr:hypothetical protein C1H46_035884 [Malus baccata]
MERAQNRARQWHQSLSHEEHPRYLARRRLIAREKRQLIPTLNDDHTMTSPSNIQQEIPEQIEHEGASSRVLLDITNRDDQTSATMRTHIGQLAHSNRSQISDGMLSIPSHNVTKKILILSVGYSCKNIRRRPYK